MRVVTVMALVALALCALLAVANAGLAWTVIGDWGSRNPKGFAKDMAKNSDKAKSKFTMAIGDNFYFKGVKSTKDKLWRTIYESIYTQRFFQKRWYVVAGNHDHYGNIQAQLDYTKKSKRWYFPKLYYNFSKSIGGGEKVEFFMLDTYQLYDRHKPGNQLTWLEGALKASTAKWRIVVGHHQVYSLGGTSKYMKKYIEGILEKYQVAAYINGHHHTLQHHKSKKVHYIVVGNTGLSKPSHRTRAAGVDTKFAFPTTKQYKKLGRKNCFGYSIMRISNSKTLTFKFFSSQGKMVYKANVNNPHK